ncbi:MAG: chemotaxis protein CheA [Methanomassiliicoccus sp.]|nr:chemotaxis protein CheA [Methanomassiliicoccus sp.]
MDNSQYLDVFIEESRENLQSLNSMLLTLEEKGFDEESMNEAFRAMHTLKGTAGVIGIPSIQELAHVMEDLFDVLRKRKAIPDRAVMELLFTGVDTIERMLEELESSGSVHISFKDLAGRIEAAIDVAPAPAAAPETTSGSDDELTLEPEELERIRQVLPEGTRPIIMSITWSEGLKFKEGRAYQVSKAIAPMSSLLASSPDMAEVSDSDEGLIMVLGTASDDDSLLTPVRNVTGVADATIHAITMGGEKTAPTPVKVEATTAPSVEAAQEKPSEPSPEAPKECVDGSEEKHGALNNSSSIRVKSKLLDKLLDLVGEIMINNIRINQIANDLKNRELKQTLQNNSRLMGEMQDIVLRTRMVPVDFIFKRFPRIVRDISLANGKEVEFIMRGNDIEIDRSLLDDIGDSLVHLLRNAVDHGIESKEDRIAKGKSPRGTIILSAFQEQSNIIITVEDDGRGMDIERITAKAISKGLITPEEATRMDDRAKMQFIFLPNFSTSEKVSDISGRGVGMDVVKTKIEGLGGFIRLDSTFGKGSRITLKLPPSMSIIRAMLVEVNEEKYAIPLENVRETVRVPLNAIHAVVDRGMFQLRDEVIPVLNIRSEFGSPEHAADEMPAVIVEKNDSRACLLVSRLIGQQEIVVKSLGKDLRQTGYFSGATILGDGKVAMILDVGAFT